MKLAIFNGSPRKSKSNSTFLMQHFLTGYSTHDANHIDINYLADISKTNEHLEKFDNADTAIIIFPLYTDAMPGQVKYFIEQLEGIDSKGKSVGFIVQSGFPEAHHSIFVERYLQKLAKRLDWNYIGTIVKGGVEGIQIMPPNMTKKLYNQFEKLGTYFAETGEYDPLILKKLRTPYKMSKIRILFFKLFMLTGLENFYWNMKLKEHHAFDNRFARPYAPKSI
jgi:NAD(P)H-dependent FMN reductase